jgi:hypothetical protein
VPDAQLTAMTADIETPVFEHLAFTRRKPWSEATVAIVTSTSLHHPDDEDFAPGGAMHVAEVKHPVWFSMAPGDRWDLEEAT